MKTYLVTGGAGFIGVNFVKYILKKYEDIKVIVLDSLTYAGDKGRLQEEIARGMIEFIYGDIRDEETVSKIFEKNEIDYVINFAAQTHVDRSIKSSKIFVETNVLGVQNLLEVAKKFWENGVDSLGYPTYKEGKKFVQISTDEVYGELERDYENLQDYFLDKITSKILGVEKVGVYGKNLFCEKSEISPSSPYSASKAGGDLLTLSYFRTYKFPINITRCSNNYGMYQHREKLIPMAIKKALAGEKIGIYGDGKNVRDWIFVEDHIRALDMVIEKGRLGEVYNIGAFNEVDNKEIVTKIIDILSKKIVENKKYYKRYSSIVKKLNENLIEHVEDRLGHDRRYAIDSSKIVKELGWKPATSFCEGLEKTILWYLENE